MISLPEFMYNIFNGTEIFWIYGQGEEKQVVVKYHHFSYLKEMKKWCLLIVSYVPGTL